MESEVSISLNNIQNIKTVNIVGIGVVRVRKLGAGEELDLSAKTRQLGKLVAELSDMDFTKFDANKPGDVGKLAELSKRAEAIADEIEDIQRFEFDTFKRCFSDDENGKVVDAIMNTLTNEERGELFKQVFGRKKQVDAPAAVTPAQEVDKSGEVTTNEQ